MKLILTLSFSVISLLLNAQLQIVELDKISGKSFCQSTDYTFQTTQHDYIVKLYEIEPKGQSNWVKVVTAFDQSTGKVTQVGKIFTGAENNPRNINGLPHPYMIGQAPNSFNIYRLNGTKSITKIDSLNFKSHAYAISGDTLIFSSTLSSSDLYVKIYAYNLADKSLKIIDSLSKSNILYHLLPINTGFFSLTSNGIYLYNGGKKHEIHTSGIRSILVQHIYQNGKIFIDCFIDKENSRALIESDGTVDGTHITYVKDYLAQSNNGPYYIKFYNNEIILTTDVYSNSKHDFRFFTYKGYSSGFEQIGKLFQQSFDPEFYTLGKGRYLLAEKLYYNKFDFSFRLYLIEKGKLNAREIALPEYDQSLFKASQFDAAFVGNEMVYIALTGVYPKEKVIYNQFMRYNQTDSTFDIIKEPIAQARYDTIYNSDSTRFNIETVYLNTICKEFTIGSKFYFLANAWNNDSFSLYTITDPTATFKKNTEPKKVVSIYPNPAKNMVFIKSNTKFVNAIVHDVAGKELRSLPILSNTVNLSGFASGTYILQLKNDAESFKQIIFIE